MAILDVREQLELFKKLLKGGIEASSEALGEVVDWMRAIPGGVVEDSEREELLNLTCKAFEITREKLDAYLKGGYQVPHEPEREDFDPLIPKGGFLRLYHEYTLKSEAPSVFHFFCGLTAFGASLQRRVTFPRGLYDLYPYFAVVLVAPTGKCRKTTATNTAVKLLREVGEISVLSDRLTPEYLCHALKTKSPEDSACAIIHAPELADFLGRQRYLEGLIPLLTALFDCPNIHSTGTIMRKEETLRNVALCMAACSTEDWLATAIPSTAFGGGFMSRLLLIVQHNTSRIFPNPPTPDRQIWEELKIFLRSLHRVKGAAKLSKDADAWFSEWYTKHRQTPTYNELFGGYHERKHDHLLRIALCLQLAEWQGLELEVEALEHSLRILNWIERYLPAMFDRISSTQVGADHQRILTQIRVAGGRMRHSDLLRRNQYYMNAKQFRECIQTLKESEAVREIHNAAEHTYILKALE